MKFYELKALMTDSELNLVKKKGIFDDEKLNLLCSEMLKVSEDEFKLSKAKIYRKVFNQTFVPEKDTFYRQKISEVHTELQFFLVNTWKKETHKKSLEDIECYLNTLLKRNAHNLFDKEWAVIFKEYKDSIDYKALSSLYEIKTRRISVIPLSKEMYEDYMDAIVNSLLYQKLAHEDRYLVQKYILFNTNNIKKLANIGEFVDEKFLNEKEKEMALKNPNPFRLINEFVLETDENKRSLLYKKIIHVIENTSISKINLIIIGKCLFNYAVEKAIQTNISESIEIMSFIERKDIIEERALGTFYFNYTTNLLKVRNWDEAEIQNDKIFKLPKIEVLPFYNNILIRQVLLKVIRKEFDQFYQFYNETRLKIKSEVEILYLRLVFAIYLFETKDYESAYRECENMKKSPFVNTELSHDESELLKILLPLFHIYNKYTTADIPKEIVKYHDKLQANEFYLKSSTIINIWLQNHFENELQIEVPTH